MKIGDLVYWSELPSLLGIVLEIRENQHPILRVRWANGATNEYRHWATWLEVVQ
jgi:hypothetical protein